MNILSSVLAVMHHLIWLANKLRGDLYISISELDSGPTYAPIARNLPDVNCRDDETLDEVTVVHTHPSLEI